MNIAEYQTDTSEIERLYREAEHKIAHAAKLGNTSAYYSLSELYSLFGELEKSLYFLEKAAQFKSLPPLEEVLEDPWLDSLKESMYFRSFLDNLEKKPTPKEER